MKIIKPGFQILNDNAPMINGECFNTSMTYEDGMKLLRKIETVARTCYKSESAITKDSALKMVTNLIERGHEAMLEHVSLSIKFTVDRGVSHELVRHRIASFAQESTRYCNYLKEKFGSEITVIEPLFYLATESDNAEAAVQKHANYEAWRKSCEFAEKTYFELLEHGSKPEEARSVLPNSLKTEIVITMNLREWRHFFKLRAAGTTGKPHPQMTEVTIPCLQQLKTFVPIIFDDITIPEN